jgi:hypothetical protein
MIELKQTSVTGKHFHLAYIKVDDNVEMPEGQTEISIGKTSVDADRKSDDPHYHEVIYEAGLPEVRNEIGEVTQEAVPGSIKIEENTMGDPHIHTIEELKIIERTPEWLKQEEEEDVVETRQLYQRAKDHDGEFLKSAAEDEDFYSGEQWDGKDKNRLKAQKRAALTINETEGKIDVLSGFYRQNRYDITYFPVEDGDEMIADILSNLVKHIQEKNNFDYREVEVFEDKVITGRGNFKVWIDYNKDIRGDIIIRDFPYDKVAYGEHKDKDCDDLEYLVSWQWMSLQKIKQLYPDKADQIGLEYDLIKGKTDVSDIPEDAKKKYQLESKMDNTTDWIKFLKDPEFVKEKEKSYRVVELHKKVYDKVNIISNLADDYIEDQFFYEDIDPEARRKIKSIPGMALIPRTIETIAIIQTAGGTLLSKEESELGNNWTLIPDYAKKRGSKVWGKVHTIKDHQRMMNKIHSNTVDIISRMSAYGWAYDQNTFPNNSAKDKFKNNASSPGFVVEIADVGRPPVKYEGAKFPSELVQEQELLSRKMMEISNINPEMVGQSSQSQQSGASFIQKREGALVGNEYLFDNSSLAKRMLGRALLKAIKIVYGNDPERIYRLLQNRIQRGNQVMVGNQDFTKYPEEEIIRKLQDTDLENYDVVVGESMQSPTKRQSVFKYMLDLAQAGLQIPPQLFYELSDLPASIKRQIQKVEQEQASQEKGVMDNKQQTELKKTIIAALPEEQKSDPRLLMAISQMDIGGQTEQQPQGGV